MTQNLFTSDLHLGHDSVARLRGFDDATEQDAEIAKRWRSVVRSEDSVWILGDLSLEKPELWVDYMGALPGRKHLILGNHDKAHPLFRNSHTQQAKYFRMFESVQTAARKYLHVRGERLEVLLSHFPYKGDHDGADVLDRHNQWRLRDEGLWLLHGHTHSKRRHTMWRQMHVGLDAWDLTPVSAARLEIEISQAMGEEDQEKITLFYTLGEAEYAALGTPPRNR